MSQTTQTLPTPAALLDAWANWRQVAGVGRIANEADYDQVAALVDSLVDEIGGDEDHPLAEVLDVLGTLMEAWENEHISIPQSSPADILRFLMEQHGLSQSDLAKIVPQPHISEILSGKRAISKTMAKRLAARFHVPADLFL